MTIDPDQVVCMRKELVDLIADLLAGRLDPARAPLDPLSDLAQDEVALLRRDWRTLPVETRLGLVKHLFEAAEADVAHDFTMVFRVALGDSDERVRADAVEGLWEDEDPVLADVLVTMLTQDPSQRVREAVAEALEHFAMLAELDELPDDSSARIRHALLTTVSNPQEAAPVRQRALGSVACMSGDDISREIEAAYRSDEEGSLAASLYAMGLSSDDRWSSQVLRQLRSTEPTVRFEAVRAAAEIEIEDALQPLLRMIVDPDPEVKQAVLEALGSIGGNQAEMVLEELSQTGEDATRVAALAALSELRFRTDPLATMPLSLDDEDELEVVGDEWDDDDDESESADEEDEE
jgi:HEAT repeat protein